MNPPALPTVRHGIDLVEVARLRDVLARTPEFASRVFTEAEQTYCLAQADPPLHFAARFAAKEAALKALGIGLGAIGIASALRDVEVVRRGTAPTLSLAGKPKTVAERLGVYHTALSLTHGRETAVASVVMLAAPGAGEER